MFINTSVIRYIENKNRNGTVESKFSVLNMKI